MDYIIEDIIEKHLHKWDDKGGNTKPGEVHPEMRDPNGNYSEEWKLWLPIDSKVTNDEISLFEKKLGYKFPEHYITFLKFKHFYELNIYEASFCKHPVYTWRDALQKMIYHGYPREYLLDNGLIPFADWSDWGYLCFNTRNILSPNNYEVVIWDHEIVDGHSTLNGYSKEKIDFKKALILLDKKDDESWASKE